MQKKIRQYFLDHKDELLADIASVVAINSVKGEAKEGMPFGEGPAKAVAEAEKIAKRMGFATKNFENYVLTINSDADAKDAHLGILCHLDVVPAGEGWTSDPFTMVERDGKIYGRGVTDDKGPAISALWSLKAVNDLGVKLSKNCRIILGADEECGSSDLDYYFTKEDYPKYSVSPDADYPIYNCEKGRFSTTIRAKYENKELPALVEFHGGDTSNAVPMKAYAVVEGISLEEAEKFAEEFANKTNTKINVSEENGKVKFLCEGVSAHASTPHVGNNAVTALLSMVAALPLKGDLADYVKGLSATFPHGDFHGEAAGIKMEDKVSGPLTCSFDILNISEGEVAGVFDVRAPICSTEANTSEVMEKTLAQYGLKLDTTKMVAPHYVDENLPFIKTLLKSYEDYSGLKGECISMGGGTYVHDIENGVAFGPCLPGTVTNIHGADEVAIIDQILLNAEIYTQVIIDMCK